MERNDSQQFAPARDFLGVYIEGPSREGFFFYPVLRARSEDPVARYPEPPSYILPDGSTHDWSLEYDPAANDGSGRIRVTFDGAVSELNLPPGLKETGTTFDRFGIVTPWIDGNAQEVYFDDLEYTYKHP
jgi:hypothetical protein